MAEHVLNVGEKVISASMPELVSAHQIQVLGGLF